MNLSFLGLAILALVAVGTQGLPPSKIVGKNDQVQKVCLDHPLHQISLWKTKEGRTSFTCGGVILEENLFLTAAHCLNGTHFPSIRIKAGCVDLEANGEVRVVNRVYIHDGYSKAPKVKGLDSDFGATNDIAIFTVDTPLVLGPRIKKAKLPSAQGFELVRRSGEVTGWGLTERFGKPRISGVLLKTKMDVISSNHAACFRWVDDKQFCALDFPNYSATAPGDSGSAFIIDDTVVGIVCAGNKDRYRADVFTKVQPYLEWIERIRQLNKNIVNGGQKPKPEPSQPTPQLKKLPPPPPPKKPISAPKKL